jgi:hypothetical protein
MPTSRATPSVNPSWPVRTVNVRLLDLDPRNSRLMARTALSQADAQRLLVEREDVVALAREIATHGLTQHESLIVVSGRGGRYIVLEGNRRTAAIRGLLDPTKMGAKAGSIPPLSAAQKKALATVRVSIAPSTASAAPSIARMHTGQNKRPWSAAAKAFHYGRLADEGLTVAEIAASQQVAPGAVRKALMTHRLLGVAASDPNLSAAERERFNTPRGWKVNPFTRFFASLKEPQRWFGMRIDDAGALVTHPTMSKAEANQTIWAVARQMLLPVPGDTKPRFDTRANPIDVITAITDPVVHAVVTRTDPVRPPGAPAPTTPTPGRIPPARPVPAHRPMAAYLTGLNGIGIVNDDALRGLITEASKVNVSHMPASAMFLQRAVVEGSLRYAIRTTAGNRMWHAFVTANSQFYGLSSLLDWCKDHQHGPLIWSRPTWVNNILGQWGGGNYKFFLDQTVHGIMSGHESKAREAALIIVPLLQGILNRTELVTTP